MELEARGFGEVDGSVCAAHIQDAALRRTLQAELGGRSCLVCARTVSNDAEPFAVPLEALLVEIVDAIRFCYRDANAVLPWDHGFQGPTNETWEVVDDVCSGVFEGDAADALTERIIEAIGDETVWTSWSSDLDVDDLAYHWQTFAETVKHASRLVLAVPDGRAESGTPQATAEYLQSLLVYVEGGLGLTRSIPAGTAFYRGRLTDDFNKFPWDATNLGPAPQNKATANRMSPAGISYFYASSDAQTAIAEIAGHGVDPYAVVAEFISTRGLRVLDLTKPPRPPSIFDHEKRHQARMAVFLETFVDQVTVDVIPDGRQHIEYAPTQVLTDYLRWVPVRKIDGIALPSSKTGQVTYVIFIGPEGVADEPAEDPSMPADDATQMQLPPDDSRTGSLAVAFDRDAAVDDLDNRVVFTLDHDAVRGYEVRRTYRGDERAFARPRRLS